MWPGYYLFKHQENICFWLCCLCCYMNNQISPCFPPRYASHLPYGRGTRLLVSHLEVFGYTKPVLEKLERQLLLQRIWVWYSTPIWLLTTICNPSSGGDSQLCVFWFPQVSGTHIICLHICNQNTETSIKNEYIS